MSELKPIRNDDEHAAAMRQIDDLLTKVDDLDESSSDRLEVLSILVHAYEQSHPEHCIDDVRDPVEALKFYLDRLGKGPIDLQNALKCTRTRAWEILNRKRPLTLSQIRALVTVFGIPADRLISPYQTATGKGRSKKSGSASKSGSRKPSQSHPPSAT